jgi:carbon storage regulator
MLVLGRKIGERIVLPETGISISVLGIQGKRVRIGIEAPQAASVYREEVWRRIADLTGPDLAVEPVGEASIECPAV